MIVACSLHDVFVGLFVDDVYFFIVKNCDASVVAEHADREKCLVFEVREMFSCRASMGRVS